MKNKISLILFISVISVGYSQNSFDLAYDNNGNMTSRKLHVDSMNPTFRKEIAESSSSRNQIDSTLLNISVYPNPVGSLLNIDITQSKPIVKASCKLRDLTGNTIQSVTIDTFKNQINMSSLATGAYFLDITISGKNYLWKIIKE